MMAPGLKSTSGWLQRLYSNYSTALYCPSIIIILLGFYFNVNNATVNIFGYVSFAHVPEAKTQLTEYLHFQCYKKLENWPLQSS